MMLALAQMDWTQVLVVGIPSTIAAIFSGVATLLATSNRRALKTPSGDRIGEVAERTHDLAAVTVAATTGAKGPVVDTARKRLNGGDSASLTSLPCES